MRNFLMLLLLCLTCGPVLAEDTEAACKTRLKGLISQMKSIEAKAAPIAWIGTLTTKRTAADQKEVDRRIQLLDDLNKQAVPLANAAIDATRHAPKSMASKAEEVRKAVEAFSDWLGNKLTYQNAGINNPSLKAIEKSEKDSYEQYKKALQQASQGL